MPFDSMPAPGWACPKPAARPKCCRGVLQGGPGPSLLAARPKCYVTACSRVGLFYPGSPPAQF